mmetsp:Transcript_10532/g.15396  ORF Transcript_10532/g.15396 Transcript_10532/m.15396 type:complete len:116 (-) Transcript_10532:1323-1670(-)|eukprot:CAMPEP_0117421690 /NCGR_PEP_ID=MMETSP0758-20121206/2707_1 /TAXON_ID=63605 /ORGANISM="Percolomonas cosmopolitus, Strain AE-1 (ATCC 50343)" /LENGTH=115 /DNA_ID=CAMNT_0005203917 /DNA_START=14 /DNA_END=361 /DNA_ORIENTATION=+
MLMRRALVNTNKIVRVNNQLVRNFRATSALKAGDGPHHSQLEKGICDVPEGWTTKYYDPEEIPTDVRALKFAREYHDGWNTTRISFIALGALAFISSLFRDEEPEAPYVEEEHHH